MATRLNIALLKSQHHSSLSDEDYYLLREAKHPDPFSILGIHATNTAWIIRTYQPQAISVRVIFDQMGAEPIELKCFKEHLFEGEFLITTILPNVATGTTPEARCTPGREVVHTTHITRSTQLASTTSYLSADQSTSCSTYGLSVCENNSSKIEHTTESVSSAYVVQQSLLPQYDVIVQFERSTQTFTDPYQFMILSDDEGLRKFNNGEITNLLSVLGCRQTSYRGNEGWMFSVWAPNAGAVSVVGDWNEWERSAHPLRKLHEHGVWDIFIPNRPKIKHKYMFHIVDKNGNSKLKIDPFAVEFENPPSHACVISQFNPSNEIPRNFTWKDAKWLVHRSKVDKFRQPMSVYEIHLPSWRRHSDGSYMNYREIAVELAKHCTRFSFTHVELMPVTHHPFEGSWGYQVSGFYGVYSRLGTPEDFKYMVNTLHENSIGVILDFVAAHFVRDDWGLAYYDGTALYEHPDPRIGEHKGWGTNAFDFKRLEVRSFLLSAIDYWIREYHLDGLRFDAVSAMIYRNYCRTDWLPNEHGGVENLEAISFITSMNRHIHLEFPEVFTIAEESTSWKGVTSEDNLDFDLKWDLGWMNDTLSYLCKPPIERGNFHNKLTFRCMYSGDERWVLPLSHDEVVSGKGSIVDKCGFIQTPFYERLCAFKVLLTYQATLTGRPLMFMGTEFAQSREWSDKISLPWTEAEEDIRRSFSDYVADLLKIYVSTKQLYAGDDQPWNFEWNECENPCSCTLGYIRKWMDEPEVLVVCNFSGQHHRNFSFPVHTAGTWTVLLNSDDWKYGGIMRSIGRNGTILAKPGAEYGFEATLQLDVPPYTALILQAPVRASQMPTLFNSETH